MFEPDAELQVRVPKDVVRKIENASKKYDVTVGFIVREALCNYLETLEIQNEDPDFNSINTLDLDQLEKTVQAAVKEVSNWKSFQNLLIQKNLEFWPKGGGLVLRKYDSKEEICKASQIGFPYSRLIKRFGEAFPGHSHQWLANRILDRDNHSLIEPD